MLPFFSGHLHRSWIGNLVKRHSPVLKYVDQGSILLVIYTAFSAAVINGLWRQVSAVHLAALILICLLILGIVLVSAT